MVLGGKGEAELRSKWNYPNLPNYIDSKKYQVWRNVCTGMDAPMSEDILLCPFRIRWLLILFSELQILWKGGKPHAGSQLQFSKQITWKACIVWSSGKVGKSARSLCSTCQTNCSVWKNWQWTLCLEPSHDICREEMAGFIVECRSSAVSVPVLHT